MNFEGLEARKLLAFSANQVGSIVTFTGTGVQNDALQLVMTKVDLLAPTPNVNFSAVGVTAGGVQQFTGVTQVIIQESETGASVDADQVRIVGVDGEDFATQGAGIAFAGGTLTISTSGIENFVLDSGATRGDVSLDGPGPAGTLTVINADVVTISGSDPLRVGDLSVAANEIDLQGSVSALVTNDKTKGTVTFDVQSPLDVDFPVVASTAASGVVTIISTAGVSQSASITGGSLVVANSVSGDVLLADAANAFSAVQIINSATGGRVEYADVDSVTVGTAGAGITGTGGVLVSSGGVLTLSSGILAGQGGVVLAANAGISQLAAAPGIVAATLSAINGSAAGALGSSSISLLSTANDIDVLASRNFVSNGGITFSNLNGYTVGNGIDAAGNPISGVLATGGGAIALTTTAGSLAVEQQVTTTSGAVSLGSKTGISQLVTGVITARSLDVQNTLSGTVSLDVASSDVDFVTGSNVGNDGSLRFKDADGFSIGQSGIGASETSGSLVLSSVAGGITQVGTITSRSLSVSADSVVLPLATNKVGFYAGAVAAGEMQFVEANGFTIDATGIAASGQVVSLAIGAGSIVQDSATSGSIVAGTLRIVTTGGVTATSLTKTANDVDVLTVDLASTGSVVVVDADDLTIGLLEGSTVGVDAAGATITLKAGGGLSQVGTVTASSLNLESGGAIDLQVAGNDVATLSAVTTGGSVAYRDLGAAGFDIAGQGIQAGTGDVSLTSAGSVTQSANIVGGSLTVANTAAAGSITLSLATNAIGGAFKATNLAASGAVAFRNSAAIDVGLITALGAVSLTADGDVLQSGAITTTGTLDVQNLSEDSGSITLENLRNSVASFTARNANVDASTTPTISLVNASDLVIASTGISAVASSVTIKATGSVTQTSGTIAALSLDVTNDSVTRGSISLGGTNDVDLFSASNSFSAGTVTFIDTDSVTIGATGIQADGNSVTVKVGGDLVQSGSLPSGTIVADSFSGTATGAGRLVLGTVFNDVERLSLSIGAAGGSASWRDDNGFTVTGITAAGGSVTLVAAGSVAQTGTIIADLFRFEGTVGATTLNAANSVSRLEVDVSAGGDFAFTQGAGALAIGAGGIVGGTNAIALTFSGALTQAGAITAAGLSLVHTGATAATISLSDDTNDVDVLTATISSQGGVLTFHDFDDVAVGTQPLSTVGLAVAGNSLILVAGDAITQSGAIQATATTINASGAVTLGNLFNRLTGDVTATATGDVSISNGQSLAIGAAGISADGYAVTLRSTGNLTQSGGIRARSLDVGNVDRSTGQITLLNALNDVDVFRAENLADGAGTIGDVAFRDLDGLEIGIAPTIVYGTLTITVAGDLTQDATDGAIFADSLIVTNLDRQSGDITLDNDDNDVDLFTATNSNVNLAAPGDVVFHDGSDLDVAAAGITAARGTVSLVAAGSITQSGRISAKTLFAENTSGVAGSIVLANLTNTVEEFGASNAYAAGQVTYADADGFSISAASGIVAAGNLVSLSAAGDLLQSATASEGIVADRLVVTNRSAADGDIILETISGANSIRFLSGTNNAVGGIFAFAGSGSITIGVAGQGVATIDGDIRLASADNALLLDADVFAGTGDVSLSASTGISQSASYWIGATALTAVVTGAGDVVLGTTDNAVDSLIANVADGDLVYVDIDSLSLDEITASGGATVSVAGDLGQIAATKVLAATLSVSNRSQAAGSIDVSNESNDVDGFSASNAYASGSVTFVDVDGVEILGVSAAGNSVAITVNADPLSAGSLTQDAARTSAVVAGSLLSINASGAGGGIIVDNVRNNVAAVAMKSSAEGAGITYVDADNVSVGLTVDGDLLGLQTANGMISLASVAGALSLDADVSAGTAAVVLSAASAIQQNNGVIVASALGATLTAAGQVVLKQSGNEVSSFAATADGATSSVAFVNSASLDLEASVVAGDLAITAAGDVTQSGAIRVTQLLSVVNTSLTAGSIDLQNAANQVAAFSAVNLASDGDPLTTDEGNIALVTTGDLSVSASGISAVETVSLQTKGDLLQDASSPIVARVVSVANDSTTRGSIILDAAGNDVDDFGGRNEAPTGEILYVDADDLAIATGGITVEVGGRIDLTVSGDLIQRVDSGAIVGGSLSVTNADSADGDILLTDAANDVDVLSASNAFAGGDVSYQDADDLEIDGISTGARVTLVAAGDLSQPATAVAGIMALELVATVSGVGADISLTAAGNNVQYFAATNTSTAGTITYRDATDFVVGVSEGAGFLEVSTVDGDIVLTSSAGSIGIAADITAASAEIALSAATGISQTGGIVSAAVLNLENSLSGSVALTATDVDELVGLISVVGSIFQFEDADSLAIGDAGFISLGQISLTVNGSLTQTGTISATLLDVTNDDVAAGTITLTESNTVDQFSALNRASGGAISFTNADSFAIGSIGVTTTGAATTTLVSESGAISAVGVITTEDLVITADAGIDVLTQTGSLDAAVLGTGDISVSEADGTAVNGLSIVGLSTADGGIAVELETGSLAIDGDITAISGATSANNDVVLNVKAGSIAGDGRITARLVDVSAAASAEVNTDATSVQGVVGTTLAVAEQSGLSIAAGGVVAGGRVTIRTGIDATKVGWLTQVGEVVAAELVASNESTIASTTAIPNGIDLTSPLNDVDRFSATVSASGGAVNFADIDDVTIGVDGVGIETLDGNVTIVAGSVIVVDPLVFGTGALSLEATAGAVTFRVSSPLGSGDRTLRTSIGYALANVAPAALLQPSVIDFLPTVTLIELSSALPDISKPIAFDGGDGDPVELAADGALLTSGDGLRFVAGSTGSEVRGLSITGFAGGAGISLTGVGTLVANTRLGVTRDGTISGNRFGVTITGSGALSNVIGGDDVADRNLIAGNTDAGIRVLNKAADTVIRGNFIGLDADGVAQGNGVGVLVDGAVRTTIDGGNVISGNDGHGLRVKNAPGTTVTGNYIGTNAASDGIEAGSSAVANAGAGIVVEGASSTGTTIGGPEAADRNIVSGNVEEGIRLEGAATGVSIFGNWIGLGADGFSPIANAVGISLSGAVRNAIGAGNVISGNTGPGIELLASSNDNIVTQVLIGTAADGENEVANGGSGILIAASSRNTVGSGAVISGNAGYGVHVKSGSVENTIAGAYVGLNLTGLSPIANVAGGILVEGTTTKNTLIGGSDPNVVSGNAGIGITVDGAEGTVLEANYVGVSAVGDAAVPNAGHGILVTDAPSTLIQNANVVSGNDGDGIRVVGMGSAGAVILGSYVGTDSFGGRAIANAGSGITVTDSAGVVIGGLADEERNIVAGNGGYGILVGGDGDAGAANVQITGNRIGVDVDGKLAVANVLGGIAIMSVESLGGTIDNNIVSGNTGHGILLTGGAGETTIFANSIGTDATGAKVLGNQGDGIRIVGGRGNTIGSISSGEGNLVSGNRGVGIRIVGADGENEGNNEIRGNIVGLDGSGAGNLGNGDDGIAIVASPNNLVAFNVVSGNSASGISVSGSASENVEIRGNLVGTNKAGTKAVANGFAGIEILDAVNTLVGGSTAVDTNVVSGNSGNGIIVDGAAATVISNNLVGLSPSGLGRLGNKGHGVVVTGGAVGTEITTANRIAYNGTAKSALGHGILVEDGADSTVIGSLVAVSGGNLIYGNTLDGIRITGGTTTATTVAANFIGTNQSRLLGLGNGGAGVAIEGSVGHAIGANLPASASAPSLGNVILGNQDGVLISSASATTVAEGNVVFGNTIQSNSRYGIAVAGGKNHTLGGERREAANTITLNGDDGVLISAGAVGIVVTGNYLGTNAALATKLGNKGDGIEIRGSLGNVIGGAGQLANIVNGNLAGVRIVDAEASDIGFGNVVAGNTIQANRAAGIHVEGSSYQTIGSVGDGNTVIGNAGDGILIAVGSNDNRVSGNLIGVTAGGTVTANLGDGIEINGGEANTVSGNTIRGNAVAGVRLVGAASNTIGGDATGDRNTITGNKSHGIIVEAAATLNTVDGNVISANGLNGVAVLSGSANVFGGNTVVQNAASGFYVAGTSTDNAITSNLIGVDGTANTKLGNRTHGVFLERANSTTVEGNTISRNLQHGVMVYGSQATSVALGNAILDNTIQANRGSGVQLEASTRVLVADNLLGGAAASGLGNVKGIELVGRSADNTIVGNRVEGSAQGGILVTSGLRNAIGGTDDGDGNQIVANTGDGIAIGSESSGNTVAGNFIGSLADGLGRRGNTANGVNLGSSTGNTVDSNTILDNRAAGIVITKSLASTIGAGNRVVSNVVRRNAVGVSVVGSRQQTIGAAGEGNIVSGNLGAGISIADGASGVVVRGNEVFGNTRDGITVSASVGSTIADNFIGTDAAGGANLGNKGNGISFVSAIARSAAEANTVTGNRIAGNAVTGVTIASNSQFVMVGTADDGNEIVLNRGAGVSVATGSKLNTIAGNFIGTDGAGTTGLGNVGDGVVLSASFSNTVGGGNVISANGGAGVRIVGSAATTAALGNTVTGNEISANTSAGVVVAAGGSHRLLGNQIFANLGRGVSVETASVRDQTLGAVISGNTVTENNSDGIFVTGGGANTISGNYVGTNASGTAGLGNQGSGILLLNSKGNTVGSMTGNGGNTVSGNFGNGVRLEGTSTANFIVGNRISSNEADGVAFVGKGVTDNVVGVQATATKPIGFGNVISGNAGAGVLVDAGLRNQIFGNQLFDNGDGDILLTLGGNASQAAPLLTSATMRRVAGRPTLRITGTVRGTARQRMIVEFFSTTGAAAGVPIGRVSVIAGTNGIATFTVDLRANLVAGDLLSATATTASGVIGNTSQMATAIPIA